VPGLMGLGLDVTDGFCLSATIYSCMYHWAHVRERRIWI